MRIKVIVCCQAQLSAEGLWCLLDPVDDIQVLGIASNEKEIRNLVQYSPDVVVTDFACCNEVMNQLSKDNEKKILLINEGHKLDNEQIKAMISDGLGGILPLDADAKLLSKAINKLHEGELWFDRHTIKDVLVHDDEVKQNQINLTKKEKEILNYVCTGMSNKEIAKKLYISEQTVKSHCNHLFKKFGVSSRLKLALYAAPKYFPENLSRLQ